MGGVELGDEVLYSYRCYQQAATKELPIVVRLSEYRQLGYRHND